MLDHSQFMDALKSMAEGKRDALDFIAPHNPWPVGSDWWHKTNELHRRAQARRSFG